MIGEEGPRIQGVKDSRACFPDIQIFVIFKHITRTLAEDPVAFYGESLTPCILMDYTA